MGKKRILIVEESERFRTMMRDALAKANHVFDVRFAATVAEAKRSVAGEGADLVVANWLLSDGFGTDLLRQGVLPAPLPVVLLVSYGNEDLGPQAIESGAVDYVLKSAANLAEFPHIVQRALREWTLRTERDQAVRRAQCCMAQMSALFDEALDVIVVVNGEDGLISRVNRRAEAVWGYAPEALVGKPLSVLLPGNDPGLLNRIDSFGATVEPIDFLRADGTRCPMDVTAALVDWDGARAAMAICRECHERLDAGAERMRELARHAEQRRVQSIAALVVGAAHEINNPAHFVLVSAHLLAHAWEDIGDRVSRACEDHPESEIAGMPAAEFNAQAPALFNGVIEGTQRIRDVVSHMREFSEVLSTAASERVHVAPLIRSAAAEERSALLAATDHLVMDVALDLPDVCGDEGRLRLALAQLIRNACQATTGRGLAITLRARYDEPRRTVVLSVEDQGAGIRPQLMDQVRDPFFTTWRASGRLGLGLALAEAIAGQHGGSVELTSVGEGAMGTRASLVLPVLPR